MTAQYPSRGDILHQDALASVVDALKLQGKTIVQSHGVFDLIHPGIIAHLEQAKRQGDILLVTVIKDKDVRRGPGRPVFSQEHRARSVASLSMVDMVALVDDSPPFECVKLVRPHIFARGQAHERRDAIIHNKIFEEEKGLFWGGCKIVQTQGASFKTSQFLANFCDLFPEETLAYLRSFQQRYSFADIVAKINSLRDIRVLLLGDAIVDEYHYCSPMGKSLKANLVVNRYLNNEVFPGGVAAVANHMAGLCRHVDLLTVIGPEDSREEFLRANLLPNIDGGLFYRESGPTVIKKRYVDPYLNQKLFEVNHVSNEVLDGACEARLLEHLAHRIDHCDLVVASDFGHGVLTPGVVEFLQGYRNKLAVNSQTNGANAGFNLITRYNRPAFVCLDELEARYATQDRYGHIRDVALKLYEMISPQYLIVTLGRRGSIGIGRDGRIATTPVFSSKVVDTVGAGDAFFSFTSLCYAKGLPHDLISFIGNAVGALAVQIVCNKKPVEKHELLEFLRALLGVESWGGELPLEV